MIIRLCQKLEDIRHALHSEDHPLDLQLAALEAKPKELFLSETQRIERAADIQSQRLEIEYKKLQVTTKLQRAQQFSLRFANMDLPDICMYCFIEHGRELQVVGLGDHSFECVGCHKGFLS